MSKPQNININDFIYELPDNKIPKYPLQERDTSKLLVRKGENISHTEFYKLPSYLPKNALLIFNNTKVIHARLLFRKLTGALIEIFCLEPKFPSQHLLALQAKKQVTWNCIVGNLKKWKEGSLVLNSKVDNITVSLVATIKARNEGSVDIEFNWDEDVTFSEILMAVGNIPIPPYLNRDSEEGDNETYQTVYAQIDGSVAAPTAGLHFTSKVLDDITKRGIQIEEVTLHVGAGTFQPVKSEYIGEHEMHHETIFVSAKLLEKLQKTPEQIIAVGTTSVRTLESLYWLGVKAVKGMNTSRLEQWEPYELDEKTDASLAFGALLNELKEKGLDYFSASTGIIIAPGYDFKVVQGIVTNFHQPRSTLLLLISAFVGGDWRTIYDYALQNEFRFLSYGDSSLLLK